MTRSDAGLPVLRLIGLSHRTAPLDIRERVAFQAGDYAPLLRRILETEGVVESLVLSTCNRSELVAVVHPSVGDDLPVFRQILEERAGGPVDRFLYRFHSVTAVEHLFRVASSLDSMVLGEAQILGQVNDAFEAAAEAGSLGPVLDRLLARARQTAKRVRTETGIGQMHVSVASVAVELSEKIFGSLLGRSALVVGAGDTAWLTLQHMAAAGIRRAYVTNRTDERAQLMADQLGFVPVPYERRMEMLNDVDVVISATASDRAILTKDDLSKAMGRRRHRPIFLIDLAIPRDIDPACGKLDGVFLYNLDDLSQVVEKNLAERQHEADRGRAIVAEEANRFLAWLETQQTVPTVVALRRRVEEIRSAEEEKALARLDHLSEKDRALVRAYGQALVGKILHEPTIRLKESRDPRDTARLIDAARTLFALDQAAEGSGASNGTAGGHGTTDTNGAADGGGEPAARDESRGRAADPPP